MPKRRRNETPQKQAMRKMMRDYMQNNDVHCILHQIRNSTKFVSYKDIKALMVDLKRLYTVATQALALQELDAFGSKWKGKYPKIHIIMGRQLGNAVHLF